MVALEKLLSLGKSKKKEINEEFIIPNKNPNSDILAFGFKELTQKKEMKGLLETINEIEEEIN